MPTVIRQHIINLLEPLAMLCPDAHPWLEDECLPSDGFPPIYGRLLDHACKREDIRGWLLSFYYDLGLEDAEDLLWHYIKVNPPETPEKWREEVFEVVPADARDVEEALRIKYQDWQDDQLEGKEEYDE